jgi:hypothetical protein
MTVYVAARYTEKPRARAVRATLVNQGYDVSSRWLYDDPKATHRIAAERDLADVARSHVVLLIEPIEAHGGGGRYIEVGYALALGKSVLVIDPDAPTDGSDGRAIFWSLPQVTVWPSLAATLPALATHAFRVAERGASVDLA